jgi:hypothetical protein
MPAREASVIPIRSEGIGSLLRPPYLVEAREQVEADLSPAAFKRIEDRAVDEAVALQEAAGLDVVTDGEQRRYAFSAIWPRLSKASTSLEAGRSDFTTKKVTRAPSGGPWSSTSFAGAGR